MLETLANRWWVFLIRGIAAIVLAVIAFAYPGMTLLALTIFFGAYAFVDGIFALAAALGGFGGSRWWALLLEGIAGLIVAFFVWTEPTISTLGLVYAVGIWAIITGVIEIVVGLQLREVISNEWVYILAGIISIAFGVLVFRYTTAGAVAIAYTVGFYALLFSVTQFAVCYRLYQLRSVARRVHPTA